MINVFNFKIRPLDSLLSGKNINIKRVLDYAKKRCMLRRSAHRFARNGYWIGDKQKEFQTIARIPEKLFLHPEFRERYWNPQADHKQRLKGICEFLKDHPEFNVTDTPVSRL